MNAQEQETLSIQMHAVLDGGDVQRFHTYRMLRENTVAQHSFYVSWWCALIWDLKPSANLLLHALRHDLGEYRTGDMPSFAKASAPLAYAELSQIEHSALATARLLLPPLSADEELTLKVADKLDGAVFGAVDYRLGNTGGAKVAHRGCTAAMRMSVSMQASRRREVVSHLTDCILQMLSNDKEHPEDER
jgi:5'-deoxynucleotidase YfbR-like HD superfamily hydrolase